MPGSPSHLARRFVDVLLSEPLEETELANVRGHLDDDLYAAFIDQQVADQRHAYRAAIAVQRGGHGNDVVVAALMHDLGKRRSRLGVIGRTLASILILMRLPLTRRMIAYRDHGEIGAAELEQLGAPELAVLYARHHHGDRPDAVPPDVWASLEAADEPPKAGTMVRSRIR